MYKKLFLFILTILFVPFIFATPKNSLCDISDDLFDFIEISSEGKMIIKYSPKNYKISTQGNKTTIIKDGIGERKNDLIEIYDTIVIIKDDKNKVKEIQYKYSLLGDAISFYSYKVGYKEGKCYMYQLDEVSIKKYKETREMITNTDMCNEILFKIAYFKSLQENREEKSILSEEQQNALKKIVSKPKYNGRQENLGIYLDRCTRYPSIFAALKEKSLWGLDKNQSGRKGGKREPRTAK